LSSTGTKSIGQPFDPEPVEELRHARGGIPDTAETEVSEVRLGGHERDRSHVGQTRLPHAVVDVERELVRRAEAGAALGGTDYDRTRVLEEALPCVLCQKGVVEVAHGLRVAVLGSQAGNLLEREPRPGGDQQRS
jgi:hypothetical protein